MVGRVYHTVRGLRHGERPPWMELKNKGMSSFRDILTEYQLLLPDAGPRQRGFLDYFKEEIKDQLKGKPPNKY